jgi:hypothetical protein
MDSHMRREADLHDFLQGRAMDEVRVEISATSGVRIPARLSGADHALQFMMKPDAAPPGAEEVLTSDLHGATQNPQDFELHVSLPAFSPKKAQAGWLRSAYLLFFAALGYRFIWRRELQVVRDRIKSPEGDEPPIFRVITPERSARRLVRIDAPDEFRSYAMFYENNIVLLPRFGDVEFYTRLAMKPDTKINCSGLEIPWPIGGPTFLFDTGESFAARGA